MTTDEAKTKIMEVASNFEQQDLVAVLNDLLDVVEPAVVEEIYAMITGGE